MSIIFENPVASIAVTAVGLAIYLSVTIYSKKTKVIQKKNIVFGDQAGGDINKQ